MSSFYNNDSNSEKKDDENSLRMQLLAQYQELAIRNIVQNSLSLCYEVCAKTGKTAGGLTAQEKACLSGCQNNKYINVHEIVHKEVEKAILDEH